MKKEILGLVVLLATFATGSYAQGTWTCKADFGGNARQDGTGLSIGSKGYIGLGYDGTTYGLKDFWEYNPATDSWSQKADFAGDGRVLAVAFSIGSKGYVGTGEGPNFVQYKDFWEYDPVINAWTRKADFGGHERAFSTGFSMGNKGYIGTGISRTCPGCDTYFNDFWEYDPVTDKWTKKANFGGGGRSNPSSFSIGNKGYIGIGYLYGWKSDFWEYDPVTNAWTSKADFGGSSREWAAGFSIGTKGYIGTGYPDDFKDFWEYDPSTNAWTRKADFGGTGRSQAVGFSIGDKGYIGTGNMSKDFWEYAPGGVGTGIPSITSFSPASGRVNTAVTISGTNFGTNPADNIVYFGAAKATVTAASTTSLTVTAPGGATYQPISVTTNHLTAYSAKPFIVTFEGGGIPFSEKTFAERNDIATNGSPQDIEMSDLDGDGKVDVVIVDIANTGVISVFRNITDQTISFAEKISFTTGDARRVAITDMDGDGKPDLAVSNWPGSISILKNTSVAGTISFAEKITYSGGNNAIATADLNNDGKPDIVSSTWLSSPGVISVLRNTSTNEAISFAPKVDYTTDIWPEVISIGDLDADGRQDIVVNCFGSFSILKNTSIGGIISFEERMNYSCTADELALGDFDSDNKPDLAGGRLVGYGSIFRNISSVGGILFAEEKELYVGDNNKIGDLDGDGKPDLVGTLRMNAVNGHALTLVRNISQPGNILFEPSVNYVTGNGPYGIAIGDLSGDGKPDIVAANSGSNTFSVFENKINSNICPRPASLRVTRITDTSALLRWGLPAEPVESFRIRYHAVGISSFVKRSVKGNSSYLVLCGLMPNTTYEWQIRSNCTEDTSAWVCGPNFTTASAMFASMLSAENAAGIKTNNVSIQVAPNPSNGNFNLLMQLPAKEAITTISLYNNFGEKVWQQQLGKLNGTVNRSIALPNKLQTGIYILKIERSDVQLTQRIVVNK